MYPAQTAVALESRGVRLKWAKPEVTENILGYFIYMSDRKDGTYTQMNRYAIQDQYEYITKELPVGRTFYFRIRVVDVEGNYTETESFPVSV